MRRNNLAAIRSIVEFANEDIRIKAYKAHEAKCTREIVRFIVQEIMEERFHKDKISKA